MENKIKMKKKCQGKGMEKERDIKKGNKQRQFWYKVNVMSGLSSDPKRDN